jgi:hypothetical protein
METENAIKMLDSNIQDAYQLLAAKRVKQIINLRTPRNHLYKRHLHIAEELSNTLRINVTVVPADKSRTFVAVDNNTYENMIGVNDCLKPTIPQNLLETPPENTYTNSNRLYNNVIIFFANIK